jgi:hypothetical protein
VTRLDTSTVPEPSTLAFVSLGGLAALVLRKTKSRNS